MRYSLVNLLACPVCSGDLAAIVVTERSAPARTRSRVLSNFVAPEGALVAPLRPGVEKTALGTVLQRYAAPPAPPERDYAVEIEMGFLACLGCDRWFPIAGALPELLPDFLRDHERDERLFEGCAPHLPGDLVEALLLAAPLRRSSGEDNGIAFKRSEIAIKESVHDPHFFSPGYSSPFNPHNTEFTLYLIKLFGAAAPLLEVKTGDALLDSGCGYAWTTEWLYKAGVEAIGVDICRTYLEIGLERMGPDRPHLVVADVENLPIRSNSMDAVLAFESAHHIPDRKKAMIGFSRALKPGGRMVLAEPGAAHEHAQVSIDVMSKYGILEKGMELDDVGEYAAGSHMGPPEQMFLVRASHRELGTVLDRAFVQTHTVVEGNLFRILRRESVLDSVRTAWREPRRVMWPRVKRRVKSALVRLGLE